MLSTRVSGFQLFQDNKLSKGGGKRKGARAKLDVLKETARSKATQQDPSIPCMGEDAGTNDNKLILGPIIAAILSAYAPTQ